MVGKSGSGKTTLGRTMLRLIRRQRAKSSMGTGCRDMRKGGSSPAAANMQMIFQDPYSSLSPRLRRLLLVDRALRSIKLRRKKQYSVRELLHMVGLSGRAEPTSTPHELVRGPGPPGGHRPRPGACGRTFIVADEPTSGLDVSVAAQYSQSDERPGRRARSDLYHHHPRSERGRVYFRPGSGHVHGQTGGGWPDSRAV